MTFKRLSFLLLTVTCFFIAGCDFLTPTESTTVKDDVETPEGMVSIPAGEFQMGSDDPEVDDDEQPVHTVSIDAFFMDKYEVTNAQYQKFVLANPRWGKDRIDSNAESLHTQAPTGRQVYNQHALAAIVDIDTPVRSSAIHCTSASERIVSESVSSV